MPARWRVRASRPLADPPGLETTLASRQRILDGRCRRAAFVPLRGTMSFYDDFDEKPSMNVASV
jgi:hypothetical protein